jgi:MFS family permease
VEKWRRWNVERKKGWLLFAILLICYAYFFPRWADWNQNSRLDMVMAVVDHGTLAIDEYYQNTGDYAYYNGHYYSDKAPGAAFLGIPVYAVLKGFLDLPVMASVMDTLTNNEALKATLREEGTGLLGHKVRFAITQTVLTFVASALPTALMGVLMYRLLVRFTTRPWPRIGVVLGYGLLTPAFAYAGAFYGHQLSAACLFTAFYLVFVGTKPLPTRSLLAVGLLLGYSVITEYPSVLIMGILFLYTFYRLSDRRRIGWVILIGALIATGWMIYNTAIFGSPLELGYSYSELWTERHHTGFMSLTWPRWEAIWGITFSPFRGLFVLSPLLLLAVPGFILWWRSGKHRPEFWVVLTSVLAMFLFNSSSIMWWGGFAVGPRYLLPMLPFMALPIIFVSHEWENRMWMRVLSIALFAWSLIATWGLTLAEQAFPPETLRKPLVEYAWTNWQTGNIARNLGMFLHLPGILSLLPLLGGAMVLLAAMWFLSRRDLASMAVIRGV